MKETPINFIDSMILATLKGRKTQTRRIIKWPSVPEGHDLNYEPFYVVDNKPFYNFKRGKEDIEVPIDSPYGKRGDRLRVKGTDITLEITKVRVERVQDISQEDALAEGIERVGGTFSIEPYKNYLGGRNCSAPSASFMTLWNSIHGPDAWDRNDWVWVYDFKKL